MARLSDSDWRAVLDFVQRVDTCPDVATFRAGVLPELRRLVPCDHAAWNEVDPVIRETHWFFDPVDAGRAGDRDALLRNVRQHPTVAYHASHPGGRACKLSDFLSLRELHRLELYDEVLAPLGIEHQIVITMPAPGSLLIGLPLHRDRRDFSERDRTVLDLVRPHLVRALRHAEARTNARRALELAKGGHAVVLLTRRGGVTHATGAVLDRLRAHFGNGPGVLPASVQLWLAGGAREPLASERDGIQLHVELAPAARDGERDALAVSERRVGVAPAELRRLGLTRRQSEILALVAAGLTTRQIAADLVLSPRTVDKHLEHVYGRLGVATRTEAAARALADPH